MRINHIDGLRGISIVSVVLFHAFPNVFPNGFLGVDYFFVISGFVISNKYFNSSSEFNFLTFLLARFKRIYPNLVLTIIVCIPFAYTLMQPDYLENFSQSLIATLLSMNNVLLSITGGYWTTANEMKPLFVTWSLGLEVQFYVFVGAIYRLFVKTKHSLLPLLFIALSVSSFLFCFLGYFLWTSSNYLLLPSRFWEFSIGIFASYASNKSFLFNKFSSNFLLLTIFFFLFNPYVSLQSSPNPIFLLPLLSLAIICLQKNYQSFAFKFLSSRVLVYLGLSSYSIYLAHNPILAFARISSINELTLTVSFLLVMASFISGFLMYEFCDNQKNIFVSNLNLLLFSPLMLFVNSFILILLSLPALFFNGFFDLRFPYLLINGKPPRGYLGKDYTDIPYSFQKLQFSQSNQPNCRFRSSIKVALFGNSQTRDFINTLILYERHIGVKFCFLYSNSILNLPISSLLYHSISKADLIILQTSSIAPVIPSFISSSKVIILILNDRERFAYNINPLFFLDYSSRRNFLLKVQTPSLAPLCLGSELFKPPHKTFHGIINSQCAFNYSVHDKLLTDNSGSIFSYDGVHLSEAGAVYLAGKLFDNQAFSSFILSLRDR